MMGVHFLFQVFEAQKYDDALVWKGETYCYGWLLDRIQHWRKVVCSENIKSGTVVVLEADFSPDAVACLLALFEQACIVVPLTPLSIQEKPEYLEIAQAEVHVSLNVPEPVTWLSQNADHKYYMQLRQTHDPGLVLFSSGSTGEPKAAVHNVSCLLKKYHKKRHNLRTLAFMLFDHIGGIDTLFYALSNGSCLITVDDRAPKSICQAIETHGVNVLPVSPTFLNLFMLSQVYKHYDLTSLKYITYGAEVMPESTLKACAKVFPQVTFLQKYGTTETGVLRSRSKTSSSVWVEMGGEGIQTRIVDGILHIKTPSAMMGYLNASSPFMEGGWFNTGDAVEVDGEYMKVLGRASDLINVGGEKVYPAEVEAVILQMRQVKDVLVYGEKNFILGHIICAQIWVGEEEVEGFDSEGFAVIVKKYCLEQLQDFKVPVKVVVSFGMQYSNRFKKIRPIFESKKLSENDA